MYRASRSPAVRRREQSVGSEHERPMTLWTLLQGVLLVMNGLAILNNERFLEKYGWGFSQMGNNPMGPSPNALKYQVIGMLHASAFLRVPLIVMNTIVVFVKLVFG